MMINLHSPTLLTLKHHNRQQTTNKCDFEVLQFLDDSKDLEQVSTGKEAIRAAKCSFAIQSTG